MQREYKSPELRELRDQQIRFAPRPKKLQQVEAAERLIAEIDGEKRTSMIIDPPNGRIPSWTPAAQAKAAARRV